MRSLTFIIVTIIMLLGSANAQEEVSHRLTAKVFAEAGFPVEIVDAARKADGLVDQTRENRVKAERYLAQIEPIYDRALGKPEIPLALFQKLQEEYEAALKNWWSTDWGLRVADNQVSALYYSWTFEGSDVKSAQVQVFQEWQTASRIEYINVSIEEKEMYRLMLNLGRYRIYRERHRDPSRPLIMRKVNYDQQ